MIIPMTKYSFIILDGDREQFLETIQEQGVVDITRSDKPVDEHSADLFAKIEDAKAEIKVLESGEDARLLDMKAERRQLLEDIKSASVWGSFNRRSFDALAEQGLKIRLYSTPEKKFDSRWEELFPLSVIDRKGGNVYFAVVGDDTFPLKETAMPEKDANEYREDLERLDDEIESHVNNLADRKKEIPDIKEYIGSLKVELDKYLAGIRGESAAEGFLCIYEGFAPQEDRERLSKVFDGMDIYYTAEDATVEDNPPIKLKNNAFARNFEVFTGMYGLPAYNEFDPTPFLSIFFLLFFAMCMGDAGYGILLVVIGFLLKGKEGGLAKLYKLIITLGIGTFVVGIFMESAFGVDLSAQSWVPEGLRNLMITGEIAGYSAQMVLALGIGVLHISLAMIVKAVWSIRKEGFKNSLSALGWTLLIVGSVIVLAVALVGLVDENTAKWIIIGIAAVSCLGIFLFNKWGRNPLLNIGSGLWDTYSMASGLMGDVLSYIRLYALGLSGGMLGSTFNTIAEMVKGQDPTWQWIPFVLILLVGHALNLAMSCLGAFVHPLRLNFVEFFKNSGYEGKGLTYNPLKK